VLAACVLLLGAAHAPAKKVPAKKYAKTLCGTFSGLSRVAGGLGDQVGTVSRNDPAAFQSQLASLLERLGNDFRDAEKNLKKVTPDVGGGRKVTKIFVSYLDDAAKKVQSAVDTFRAADPHGVAFTADVTSLQVSLQTLDATLGDPFSKVKSQELLGALKNEKSCKEVVTVFG
jgi:hypothetical protein